MGERRSETDSSGKGNPFSYWFIPNDAKAGITEKAVILVASAMRLFSGNQKASQRLNLHKPCALYHITVNTKMIQQNRQEQRLGNQNVFPFSDSFDQPVSTGLRCALPAPLAVGKAAFLVGEGTKRNIIKQGVNGPFTGKKNFLVSEGDLS